MSDGERAASEPAPEADPSPADDPSPAEDEELSFDGIQQPPVTEIIPSIIEEAKPPPPPEKTKKIAVLLEGANEPVPLESTSKANPTGTQKLSKTQKILSATWKTATGGFKAITSGFAWRTTDDDPDGPKVIARRRPSGRNASVGKTPGWVWGLVVIAALGGLITTWVVYLKKDEPPPQGPLFPTGK